jgi:hypothetical protein
MSTCGVSFQWNLLGKNVGEQDRKSSPRVHPVCATKGAMGSWLKLFWKCGNALAPLPQPEVHWCLLCTPPVLYVLSLAVPLLPQEKGVLGTPGRWDYSLQVLGSVSRGHWVAWPPTWPGLPWWPWF